MFIVWYQVWRLIIRFYILPLGYWSCTISTPRGACSPAAISAHCTYRVTHCHLCPTRYSFSPDLSEALDDEAPCTRTQHRNNVPRMRGKKHDISLKILYQTGFETAWQAATLAKRHALTITPHLTISLSIQRFNQLQALDLKKWSHNNH